MTDTHDNLESRLRDATTWSGPSPQLWKRALAVQAKSSSAASGVIAFARRRWFPLVSLASAACLAIAIVGPQAIRTGSSDELRGIGQSSYIYAADGKDFPRSGADRVLRISPTLSPTDTTGQYDFTNEKHLSYSYQNQSPTETPLATQSEPVFPLMADANPYVKGQIASPVANNRHIIHKATLELTTPDVRAAFLKAGLLLNEALGEHVQDSSLTGVGDNMTGALTLRVDASRLSKILNDLRELGTVVSERQEGQDVTGQVVDLEARLRNERRVEQELLELFDQRKDTPLKEILDLRQKLSEVRSGIEQMVAQREQLSRLVSLATVLVIIRTGEKPIEEPKAEGLWHYFSESIQHAWQRGLRGLADTIAALLAILVGGLIWWILLAIALLLLRRYVRNRTTRP